MWNHSTQLLEATNWQNVTSSSSCGEAWLSFKNTFLELLDKIAPIKVMPLKHGTDPWMTGEVLHLIHERNHALKKFKVTKCNTWYDKYVQLRNQVQIKKTQAKSNYYVNKVEENKNYPRKLWQTLKSLGTSSKSKSKSQNIGLKIDSNITFDKSKVSETFNSYFSTIASSLLNKLPTGTNRFGLHHVNQFYNSLNVSNFSFTFQPVSEDQVLKILQSLNSNKATGLDQLPARFLNPLRCSVKRCS